MATTNEKIRISLEGDVTHLLSQLNKVKSELNKVAQNTDISLNINVADLNKTVKRINILKEAIQKSTTIGDSKSLNFQQLNAYAKKTGVSINSLAKDINKFSKETGVGIDVSDKLSDKMMKLESPARRAATAFDKFGVSLMNSLRYNVVNNFVDNLLSKGGEITELLTEVDSRLTQIKIVSGKSSGAIQGVRENALIGAKDLATSTNEVLSAYETYYQQGLSAAEAKSRAEATIMAANVSDQSVSSTAEQVTAVLNGFNISAEHTVDVLSKMANIGAKTATDFAEIAKAAQKVASASESANLELDDTLAAMATISSVTREAPETIGTSLNAILGRIGNLKVDDGYTSAIEKIYKNTGSGLSLFDKQTGLLKDASTILSELAEKWNILDINQQKAITSQLAGTRQANRLLALMDNWDMFEQYKEYAQNSSGALEEQNDIYLQSVEAAQKRFENAWDKFWLDLFDEDSLKTLYDYGSRFIELLDDATQASGGLYSILRSVSGLTARTIGKQVGSYIGNSVQANYLRQSVKTTESQKSLSEANEATNVVFKQLDLPANNLLNTYERLTFLSKEQSDNYERDTDELKQQTKILEEQERIINSRAFGDIKYTVAQYDDETAEVNTQKQTITTASDYMRFLNNIVNKPQTGLEEEEKSADYFAKVLQQVFSKNGTAYNVKSDNIQREQIETDFANFQAIKDVFTNLKNVAVTEGNELIEKLMSEASVEFTKTIKRDKTKAELSKEYPDIYTASHGKDGAYKYGIKQIKERGDNREELSGEEQKLYKQIQKSEQNKSIDITEQISLGIREIFDSGFDKAKLGLDSITDEEFYPAIMDMMRHVLNKVATELPEVGETIQKQAENEGQAVEKKQKATDEITKLNPKIIAAEKAARAAKTTENIFKYSQMASVAISGLTQALDENLSAQERFSILINTLGSGLSVLPGKIGAIGFAISVVGPALIQLLGMWEDQTKLLQKQIDGVKKSNDALTLSVKEQKSELSNINNDYISLIESYEKGELQLSNLTGEQKQQYEQVADYVSKYAPELVKYYDTEGKAVIDLTDKYNSLSKTKKSYLQIQQEANERAVYSQLKGTADENANLLIKNYSANLKNVGKIRSQIQKKQADALSGKDVSEELENLEEDLTKAQDNIASISSDWDNMFTKIVTRSSSTYFHLNADIQNSILSAASFSSFLKTDLDVSAEIFQQRIEKLITALSTLSEEQQKVFTELSANIKESLLQTVVSLELSEDKIKQFLTNIKSDQDAYTGTYINELGKANKEGIDNRRKEAYNRKQSALGSDEYIDRAPTQEELVVQNTKLFDKSKQIDSDKVSEAHKSESLDNLENPAIMQKQYQKSLEESTQASFEYAEAVEENNLLIKKSQDSVNEAYMATVESMRQMANSSNETFNEMLDSYTKMYDAISENGIDKVFEDFGFDTAEEMEKAMGGMYAALNGDSEEFYKNWIENNTNAINENALNLGIYADDYKTYNEYMDSVNNAVAQNKVLYEAIANEGIAGAQEQLNNFKIQSMTEELAKLGDTETLKQYMALDTNQQIKYANNQKTIEYLKSLDVEADGAYESAKTAVEQNAKQNVALSTNSNIFVNGLKRLFSWIPGLFSGGSNAASTEGYKTSIDKADKYITDQITKLENENKALLAGADKNLANKYEDLANQFVNEGKKPTYNFDYGGKLPNRKPISSNNKNNNTSGIGGSGKNKKGGSGGSDKEVEDMELELDILRPYIIALEELEHELDIISEKKEQVWGQQYVDYLKQELEINKKSLEVNENKLQAAKEYANVLKQQLAKQGAEFTDYGAISNYNQLLESKVKAANSKSGDAKKAAQESVKTLQKLMDKYEKYALDTVRDIEKEILDVKNNIAEAAQEQIEYFVEIIVETKDNKNDLMEFLADVQKHKKGEVNFSIDISSNADQLINSLNALQEIESKTSVDNLIKEVLENPDLQGMTDKQLEIIQNRIEELQDLGSELIKFEEAFTEAFSDAFDEAIDLLDDQLSKYDNILDQYNYILDLAEKINKKDLDFNAQTYDKIISIYKNNLDATKQLAEDIKASRDQFEVGTKDWQIANEKYLEAQANVIKQEKDLTEALENKFDSTASIGRDKIENALFNGKTAEDAERQLDKLNKLRDKYLDKERKIYALDKMKYGIMEDMKEYEFNPQAQKELEDWMNKEMDYLHNKKDLTQDDLDLAEKQYAVMKARIDMENAYNNKKYTAMLQRNADGTYGYMYIQDTSQYEAASQQYRDAIDDLYNYSLERNEALQKENIELKQEALEEYDRIVSQLKAGMITSEEATKLLQETFNQLQDNLKQNAAEQEQIAQNAVASTQLQIIMNEMMNTESMDRIQDLSTETQQIIRDNLTAAGMDYDDFVNSKLYQELNREDMFTADITEEWNKLDELIKNDMDSIANDFNFSNEDSMISGVVNSINDAYKEFNKVVTDAFQNAVNRQEELINSTNDMNKQTETLNKKLADEIEKVTELKNKYNDLRNNVTKALDDITKSLNKLMEAHTKVQSSANKGSNSSGSSSGKGSSSSGSHSSGSGSSSHGSGSGSNLKRGGRVKVKPGRRWYYDSKGKNPSGPTTPYANKTLYIVNTSSNSYPYALGSSSSVSSALGWVKKSDLVGYDTGGYTGNWHSKEGRLALLHEKEIVLNKDDTKNFLKGLELSNDLVRQNINGYKVDNSKNNETINYNNFEIDFPNATNSDEIRRAIESLPAMANQYLGRKK